MAFLLLLLEVRESLGGVARHRTSADRESGMPLASNRRAALEDRTERELT
jgi:hypothetical protein